MNDPFSLYRNIKKARISAGISQKELAEKLGLSDRAISAYETGRVVPPSSTLARIADILNITVSEMVGGDESLIQKVESLEKRLANVEQALISYMKDM